MGGWVIFTDAGEEGVDQWEEDLKLDSGRAGRCTEQTVQCVRGCTQTL